MFSVLSIPSLFKGMVVTTHEVYYDPLGGKGLDAASVPVVFGLFCGHAR